MGSLLDGPTFWVIMAKDFDHPLTEPAFNITPSTKSMLPNCIKPTSRIGYPVASPWYLQEPKRLAILQHFLMFKIQRGVSKSRRKRHLCACRVNQPLIWSNPCVTATSKHRDFLTTTSLIWFHWTRVPKGPLLSSDPKVGRGRLFHERSANDSGQHHVSSYNCQEALHVTVAQPGRPRDRVTSLIRSLWANK